MLLAAAIGNGRMLHRCCLRAVAMMRPTFVDSDVIVDEFNRYERARSCQYRDSLQSIWATGRTTALFDPSCLCPSSWLTLAPTEMDHIMKLAIILEQFSRTNFAPTLKRQSCVEPVLFTWLKSELAHACAHQDAPASKVQQKAS